MQTQDNEALFYDVMDNEAEILQTPVAQNENAEYPSCQMFTSQDKNQLQVILSVFSVRSFVYDN